MKSILLLFSALLCTLALSGCQTEERQYITSSLAVPLQIPPSSEGPKTSSNPAVVDYIVVQKKDRLLSLWKDGRIVKTYPIMAMGESPVGHKAQEGDERTPEGQYFINDKHLSQHFQKFLQISYPNEADKKNAEKLGLRVGGNVGIHGDRGGFSGFLQRFDRKWTDGCIAMRNADIEDIYGRVDVGTPIVIKP